ncbi:TPA: ComEC/Rec2 family competence protein [Vibrio parahaemolyticus]|uniref:ComEC/Rec2 family competence protein n=3 Tax=Vibrio parahaemolyticus TaxID=670 RepID=UPI0006A584F9|nr:hypothetical protein [Vibrio parahaemolyticus]EGQ7684923.1 hypothetical protein [Vibrio parahaemolyticus]EGQ7836109.1 hypothetical protein [Vibrio parahaemolyticus]EGQ8183917.1 hypothetical protein [Vibrio parahaemolyticus]EGQ9458317.1 hypothetical protein [Vibrio parahaemolyticus]EJD0681926.1 hypothetical protein [Vibrio parahaemolyticus]
MEEVPEIKSIEAKLYALPAGQGDCLLFQFQDLDEIYHNILVDGGNRNRVEFNKQKKKILEILDDGKKGKLDLVVVTHSDDDHIKGILNLLGDSNLEPLVEKVWFNSERTISEYLEVQCQDTQNYKIYQESKSSVKSSRKQDNTLYNLLDSDRRWGKEIIIRGKTEKIGNLNITVLSPTKENLNVLNKYWPTQKLGSVKSSAKKGFDYNISLKEFLNNLPEFKEDKQPVNGASIALLLEWMGKKFMLLSDSYPSVITESLSLLYRDLPLKLDAMKVSHHGSKSNTSKELIESVQCRDYIISANANVRHYHPNKETLCRIIASNGIDDTFFHFTYENSNLKRMFHNEAEVNVLFPTDKEVGVCLSYEC